jgi:hypothetical protein
MGGGGVFLILSRVSARCNFHKSLNWARLVHKHGSATLSKNPTLVYRIANSVTDLMRPWFTFVKSY